MINILIYYISIINFFSILSIPTPLIINKNIDSEKKILLKTKKIQHINNNDLVKKTNNKKNDINILMMLPLFKEKPHLKHEFKNDSIDLFIGAKAAIKFLSKTKKINFKIFDTENNKEKIRKFLKKENDSSTDLIIGPLFRSNIEEVAKILKHNQVPIISPFSNSTTLDRYTNIFQTKAKDKFLIEPIFKEIKNNRHRANIIYLIGVTKKTINISKYLKSLLVKEKLPINIKQVKSLSNIKNQKNPFFAILLNENPELGKCFVKDIQKFSSDNIIPLGIGYNNAYYNNIEILKKYKFIFTVRYHINNKTSIYNVINSLISKHTDIPNQNNFLGFDIILDSCERIFNKNVVNQKSIGLISKYRYQKLPHGGYINRAIWLIKFK